MIRKTNDCVYVPSLLAVVICLVFSATLPGNSPYAADDGETLDFSGIYLHRHSKASRGGEGNDLNEPAPTSEALALMEAYDPADDFVIQCEPPGLKRQLLHPYPMKITQYPDRLEFWYEGWEAERTIFLDGKRPDNIEHSKLGYSVGRFEGNDLIIETNALTWGFLDEVTGLKYSEDALFTERYTRYDDPEDNHITLHLTIEDPRRLEEPMLVSDAWTWDPTTTLLDYECLIPEEHGLGR